MERIPRRAQGPRRLFHLDRPFRLPQHQEPVRRHAPERTDRTPRRRALLGHSRTPRRLASPRGSLADRSTRTYTRVVEQSPAARPGEAESIRYCHASGGKAACARDACVLTLTALAAVIASRAVADVSAATNTPALAVTETVMLVGDSVPKSLADEFADAAAQYGYVVVSAAVAGCPATGVGKVYSSGKRFKTNTCEKVVGQQDAMIERERPALVIWWSRYELAPRLGPDGKVLPLGSRAHLRAQQASFEVRARALRKQGARLVTVQIEPPGRPLAARNPSEKSVPRRADASPSAGRRERLERVPRQAQGAGGVLRIDRRSGLSRRQEPVRRHPPERRTRSARRGALLGRCPTYARPADLRCSLARRSPGVRVPAVEGAALPAR